MITIGQLAAYAGVTVKAVRHYHQQGLLAEPERDAAGYRRYTAQHAIDLVKIKTLARAGVPLARIKDLLAADTDQFADAVAEIDLVLRDRIEELLCTRERLAHLSGGGDRPFVSAQAADYLDRLRELGISERGMRMERDGWILLETASPKDAAAWLAGKVEALDDPEFRAIYVEYDAAFGWSPDDPRLEALADRIRNWLTQQHDESRSVHEPAIARLLRASIDDLSSPALDRLATLAAPSTPPHTGRPAPGGSLG